MNVGESSLEIADMRHDHSRDIGQMFVRVFFSSLCFAIFSWVTNTHTRTPTEGVIENLFVCLFDIDVLL